jgi:hypothetical protein
VRVVRYTKFITVEERKFAAVSDPRQCLLILMVKAGKGYTEGK